MPLKTILVTGFAAVVLSAAEPDPRFPKIPTEYLVETTVPDFWVTSVPEVGRFLDSRIHKGKVEAIGTTAGRRSLRAVFYGQSRQGKGTTTFSGSIGFGDVKAYLGPDFEKKVYMAFACVHGAEVESVAGIVNLLNVLETGRDLRGQEWPGISEAARRLDRVILIPITNVDGRARVPIRMLRHWGTDARVAEYFNTGGWPDGSNIGWPQCKQFIPLDFMKTGFPGGYPNDAGVNIQHDDFFSRSRQPETDALLQLTARERPDLTVNLHTGAVFTKIMRSFIQAELNPAFEEFYRRVLGGLTLANLERTRDVAWETDPGRAGPSGYNLETAINLNCGALAVLIESPSHAFSTATRDDKPFNHTPDDLVNAQLTCHQEAMKFLVETGGRARWTAKKR